MPDTSAKTFPGVYTQIIDQSFLPLRQSRFRPALIGVTSKGPFDTPTTVRSLKEFLTVFGNPVASYLPTGSTESVEYYLADAVGMVADYTNAMTIVRVGNKFASADLVAASGTATGTLVNFTNPQTIYDLLNVVEPVGELWVRISEDGKLSTSTKVTTAAFVNGSIATVETALNDAYTAATVEYSKYENAAEKAEGVLYGYTYGAAVPGVGAIRGDKGAYSFVVASGSAAGALIDLDKTYRLATTGTNRAATPEIRIESVVNGTGHLVTTESSRTGYQSLPLQDSYSTDYPAYLYPVTASYKALFLRAKTEGEWANGTSSSTGLYVRVRPGSAPGTKKLEVYNGGGLVESFDNIAAGAEVSDVSNYETALANSQHVEVVMLNGSEVANTVHPWDATYYGAAEGRKALNAGTLVSSGTTYATGGQFTGGENGNNVQETDIIGAYDPVTDTYTGLLTLEDADNVDVNVIACPMNFETLPEEGVSKGAALMQRMAEVAANLNAIALADVPPGLNAAQATDWHNGAGLYTGRPRIDSPNLAIYWNWFTINDRFTSLPKDVPPTLGALRCLAYTFERDQPWYAAAGETRGFIPEASAVEYDRVSVDTKHAMYGNGNSVNPILKIRGRHYVYGERTMQRAESKLTAVHSVILVTTVVKGLAEIGRRFVFDPNDLELLIHIRLAFSEYLDKIRNQRGIEEYELVVDERNNSADTRNRREVIVDLAVIPTDVMERMFINATVRESGAQLNSVTTTTT